MKDEEKTVSSMNLSRIRRITSSAFVTCVAATTIAAAASGCSGDKVTQGELILAVQTDMSLPKDVDEVRIEVTSFGNVVFKNRYPVGAGGLRIPATLGILPGANARALVTIRVIAMQRGKPRMLREVVTTVPASRLATLRLPIQWLSDGSAKVQGSNTSTDGGTSFRSLHPAAGEVGDEIIESTCPPEQTNIAGECVDWNVDSETLPDYSAEDVFGGGKEDGTGGACFDTLGCMQSAVTVQPDGSCTIIPPSAEPGRLNVALRLPLGGDGICDDAHCYIPLDSAAGSGWVGTSGGSFGSGTGGDGGSGTTEPGPAPADAGTGDRPPPDAGKIHRIHEQAGEDAGLAASGPITSIKLPAVICRKITGGLQAQVVVSTGCATKLPSNPTCGPWSSVAGSGGTPTPDPLVDSGAIQDATPADDASTRVDASPGDASKPPMVLSIDPPNPKVTPMQQVQFTAYFFDGTSNIATSALWSVDDTTVGTIDPVTGLFTTADRTTGFTFVRAKTTSPALNAETMVAISGQGADAGTTFDAGGPPDASTGCTVPSCSSTGGGDAGPGTCDCTATCDGGLVHMTCDGSNCTCMGGSGSSAPQGSACFQPASEFNVLCAGP
ncbi:MAG: putative rane protein [Myxococcaceae bacterium]|nr:putative rane protein [Myxococcaceae bacterium]